MSRPIRNISVKNTELYAAATNLDVACVQKREQVDQIKYAPIYLITGGQSIDFIGTPFINICGINNRRNANEMKPPANVPISACSWKKRKIKNGFVVKKNQNQKAVFSNVS
jgi:hypothetical protein